ncbi:hypothetical protein J6590_082325 [Homalodisca vitripennis]|nr:hypothetical protein J6590_082325 [Homalodisca vitripennis]
MRGNSQQEVKAPGTARAPDIGSDTLVQPLEPFLLKDCDDSVPEPVVLRNWRPTIVHCNNISLDVHMLTQAPGTARAPDIGSDTLVQPLEPFLLKDCDDSVPEPVVLRNWRPTIVHCNNISLDVHMLTQAPGTARAPDIGSDTLVQPLEPFLLKDCDDSVPEPVVLRNWPPDIGSDTLVQPLDPFLLKDCDDSVPDPVVLRNWRPTIVHCNNISLDVHMLTQAPGTARAPDIRSDTLVQSLEPFLLKDCDDNVPDLVVLRNWCPTIVHCNNISLDVHMLTQAPILQITVV